VRILNAQGNLRCLIHFGNLPHGFERAIYHIRQDATNSEPAPYWLICCVLMSRPGRNTSW
jgi:hypothetical protein